MKKLQNYKVLHVAGTIGTVLYFRLPLLELIRDLGGKNWIVSTDNKGHDLSQLRKRGIEFRGMKIRNASFFECIYSIYSLIRLIRREKFDVVHTNTPMGGLIGRVAAILSFQSAELFHTTGGIPLSSKSSILKRKSYFFVERILARFTTVILTPSRRDLETYVNEGLVPLGSLLYCGPAGYEMAKYDLSDKEKYRNSFLEEMNFEDNVVVIGIVARLVKEKGIMEFLEVSERLIKQGYCHLRFVIVGDGPLLSKLKDNYNHRPISFLGRRSDVNRIMFALDIFLFPSYREGNPVAVIEAMAAQTPVVAFDINGCRESINTEVEGLLVPFGDTEQLSVATETLVNSPYLRVEMGNRARQKVELLTKENHIKIHLLEYLKLVKV